ncbi:MAG TPA: hypothetical protein VHC42_11295 [Rhizomicrobium sp.]|nr:hypothetical protein [Rhizomicrobium sp.]
MRNGLIALTALAGAFAAPLAVAAQSLHTWNGSFTYNSTQYAFTMVGTNPNGSVRTTTIPVYIIPIRVVYTYVDPQTAFDPLVDQWNGVTAINAILNSPLFQSASWRWGGTDMGTTQYLDAFQRGSFWNVGVQNTDYHVTLSPTVLPELEFDVTSRVYGTLSTDANGNEFGSVLGPAFKPFIQQSIANMTASGLLNPGVLPVFITDDVRLTEISQRGYHGDNGDGQTFVYSTFNTYAGDESGPLYLDIATLTHELGEWMDDPFVTSNPNLSPCDGDLEVGDPLQGDYYTASFGGLSYHPQALTFMNYFGAANYSVNNLLDNKNDLSVVCQNGALLRSKKR